MHRGTEFSPLDFNFFGKDKVCYRECNLFIFYLIVRIHTTLVKFNGFGDGMQLSNVH